MAKRHVLSYALFAVGVLFFLLVAVVARQWTLGVALGLALVLAGVIFYRRGK